MGQSPFTIMGQGATAVNSDPTSGDIKNRITDLISSSEVFLFMKGTSEMPQCGFSSNSTAILNSLNVTYNTFNILSDEEIRQGVKEFSNWPTFPQLFFKGELVGGNDIITEMHNSGELQTLLKKEV